MYLVKLDKLFPLILSDGEARLEPPDLNPVSDENIGCHGVWRTGRKYESEGKHETRDNASSKGWLKWHLARDQFHTAWATGWFTVVVREYILTMIVNDHPTHRSTHGLINNLIHGLITTRAGPRSNAWFGLMQFLICHLCRTSPRALKISRAVG